MGLGPIRELLGSYRNDARDFWGAAVHTQGTGQSDCRGGAGKTDPDYEENALIEYVIKWHMVHCGVSNQISIFKRNRYACTYRMSLFVGEYNTH